MSRAAGITPWSDRIRRDTSSSVGRDEHFAEITKPWTDWDPGFCEAVQIAAIGGRGGFGAWNTEFNTFDTFWKAYPWLTFVMGSGPLGLPRRLVDRSDVIPEEIAQAMLESLRPGSGWRPIEFGFDLQDIRAGAAHSVIEFTTAVIQTRLHPGDILASGRSRGDVGDLDQLAARPDSPFSPFTGRLALFSAELTRAFHWLSQHEVRPTGRWGDDTAALRADDSLFSQFELRFGRGLRALAHDLLSTQRQELEPSNSRDYDQGFFAALDAILTALEESLTTGTSGAVGIATADLQLVNDCFWYCLLREVAPDHYPGWTDLLVRLVLKTRAGEKRFQSNKPHWGRIQDLERAIGSLMTPPAEASWAEGEVLGAGAARHYEAVARTLWAQADTFQRSGVRGAIRPVAFVTSLDSELEKALWNTAGERAAVSGEFRRFSVVIPTYFVHHDNAELGEPVWLERVVDVDPSVPLGDRLRATLGAEASRTDTWRIMRGSRSDTDLPAHPVIVRLTGAPYFELPKLEDLLRQAPSFAGEKVPFVVDWQSIHGMDGTDLVGDYPTLGTFHHAVTIDEYLALRQSIAESFWSAITMRGTGLFKGDPSRGLPRALLLTAPDRPTRFWMLMGVPIHDSAVRLRLLTIMSSQSWASSAASADVGPTSAEPASPGRGSGLPAPSGGMPAPSGGMPPPSKGMPGPSPALQAASAPESIEGSGSSQAPHRLAGYAVNVHLGDDEIGLMSSLGLTVIRGRAEEFTGDLDDYARHLVAGTRPGKGCHDLHAADDATARG